MTNKELQDYLKQFINSENAEKMGEVFQSIQDNENQLEKAKEENVKLKDKIVSMVTSVPVKEIKEEQPVEPAHADQLSIDEAIAGWAEQNLNKEKK